MTDSPLTVQWAFGIGVSFLMSLLWYWVRAIADSLKSTRHSIEELRDELHQVKLDYATKAEARADVAGVMNTLGRLENKIDKLSDKLDKKADKT